MEINKKQAGTIFIAVIFIFSAISFAINLASSPTRAKTQEKSGVVTQPIADSQRSAFISNDVTILTLFYLQDDEDSKEMLEEVEKLSDEFGSKLIVEEVNIGKHPSFSAEYNVRVVPVTLIRGKSNVNAPIRLEGLQEYALLKEKLCSSYSEKPSVCG